MRPMSTRRLHTLPARATIAFHALSMPMRTRRLDDEEMTYAHPRKLMGQLGAGGAAIGGELACRLRHLDSATCCLGNPMSTSAHPPRGAGAFVPCFSTVMRRRPHPAMRRRIFIPRVAHPAAESEGGRRPPLPFAGRRGSGSSRTANSDRPSIRSIAAEEGCRTTCAAPSAEHPSGAVPSVTVPAPNRTSSRAERRVLPGRRAGASTASRHERSDRLVVVDGLLFVTYRRRVRLATGPRAGSWLGHIGHGGGRAVAPLEYGSVWIVYADRTASCVAVLPVASSRFQLHIVGRNCSMRPSGVPWCCPPNVCRPRIR
jgi:hypothetical protein